MDILLFKVLYILILYLTILKTKDKIKEAIEMCSVGGADFDLEIEKIEVDRYKCNNCGNKFDAIGEKVVCPSCQSKNVVKL